MSEQELSGPAVAPAPVIPLAPQDDGSGIIPAPPEETPAPAPITEEEVGEYREQDRFLPVGRLYPLCFSSAKPPLTLLFEPVHLYVPSPAR